MELPEVPVVKKEFEIEYFLQEEDTDGKGTSLGWVNYSPHNSREEALEALAWVEPQEGRTRVVRVLTEVLAIRDL
jgi:hypothetical protein